jgi:hypothetical protein
LGKLKLALLLGYEEYKEKLSNNVPEKPTLDSSRTKGHENRTEVMMQ